MFSANENLALRQHKRRIVEYVEETIPEDALDMGTMVMVMQVQCKAPGCVPIETAIVIVFPKVSEELMKGLAESAGGSYKTKVLKPMADVTKEDVCEVLPPQFKGGQRTMTKLCYQARDVMLAQITQLFGDGTAGETNNATTSKDPTLKERQLMAQYLQQSLQDYLDRGCIPPEWGEPYNNIEKEETSNKADTGEEPAKPETSTTTTEKSPKKPTTTTTTSSMNTMFQGSGNFVFRRPNDDDDDDDEDDAKRTRTVTTGTFTSSSNSSNLISQLEKHAPGVRVAGCPCCDPDDPANVADKIIGGM